MRLFFHVSRNLSSKLRIILAITIFYCSFVSHICDNMPTLQLCSWLEAWNSLQKLLLLESQDFFDLVSLCVCFYFLHTNARGLWAGTEAVIHELEEIDSIEVLLKKILGRDSVS